MKTIAFFNNKGGVGKTSLVYHLAWMYADLGIKVIAADLDPQSNLTSMFLDEDQLEELWPPNEHERTIFGAIRPLLRGIGDIATPYIVDVADNIGLVAGDLVLSSFEDELSSQWPDCLDGKERAFRVISAFYRVLAQAAIARDAELVLVDVGPNLGAINRAAIIAAEHITIPLAPDLFSLQGLRNLGPTLRRWRREWQERLQKNPDAELCLPTGMMQPVGYVVLQHTIRLDRPVKAYGRWMERIPAEYRQSVLDEEITHVPGVADDPYCLATLKHYRSLMPLAMDARKPMFFLKPADGAIGSHLSAVHSCYEDFKNLAQQIAERCDFAVPYVY
ncbi:MAG: ParA family protein [Chloroflexaceae bacterium]